MISPKLFTFLGFVSTVIGAVMLATFVTPPAEEPQSVAVVASPEAVAEEPVGEVAGVIEESVKDVPLFAVPETDGQFDFSLLLPSSWEVQAADRGDGILISDPASQGDTATEKAQLYIQRFESQGFPEKAFSSLSNNDSIVRSNRQDIQASATMKETAITKDMPDWLSERHLISGIQVGDVLYTVSKRPGLDARIYERILDTITLPQ